MIELKLFLSAPTVPDDMHHLVSGIISLSLSINLVPVSLSLTHSFLLVHGQVTIIFVVSVCLSVCLCRVFSQPSLIRFR